jgi:hypothetical protein
MLAMAQITYSFSSVHNAFQDSHSCFSEVKYQVDTNINCHSSYEAGNGRFQKLYNGRLLASLGCKRQRLEDSFERARDAPSPSTFSEIASLDRCTLLLREATRALQGGYLTAWVRRFSHGGGGTSELGPIPLVVQAKRRLEDMAKVDECHYGAAARELWKEGACSEEHGDAVMDAVITLVVEMQFPGEKETLLV